MIILYLLFTFIIIYLFAIVPRLSKRRDMEAWKQTMFAHRGYHNAEKGIPENSMAAFRAAIARGYGIELDVHLTKDGQVVVFHDDTLERVCGCAGVIDDMTLAELRTCRLSGTSEQIPLFKDVLELVDGQVPLLIELKLPVHSYVLCEKVYTLLRNYSGAYLIQSFNSLGLRWFKLHAPDVLRGQLSSRLTKDNLKQSWATRFMIEYLLSNLIGRPDFISYKLADLPNISVSILKSVFHTPTAVWTLRTREALQKGVSGYDIQIFEKHGENYK